ncbi:extracellular solute-binding protein [Microbacterium terregens]|uniref:Extracellular solute-binding protein n=1 Tax=Microbacterium terregens TaxID=69363 RepID=A0ABV5T438_9MICO
MKKAISGLGMLAALMFTVSACAAVDPVSADPDGTRSAPPTSDVVLTWETTGGPSTEREKAAFQDPYTATTGVRFENVSSPTAVNQIQTMVETGNVLWDITHKGSFVAVQHCGTLFEEVDFASLPLDLFPDGSTSACARPLTKYGTAFAYDHEVYTGKVPSKIEDFFDLEAFPGKRVVYAASARGVFEAALAADGVAADNMYPLDIDRALAKLDTIKSDLIFAPTLPALQQNMLDKQATMTLTLTGGLGSIYDRGGTITPVWDFTAWDFDALLIPKGSKNTEEAAKAIEFSLQPEQVIRYAETGGQAPARNDVDINSIDYSESQRLFNPFLNTDKGELCLLDPTWWAENSSRAAEAYVAWQVG